MVSTTTGTGTQTVPQGVISLDNQDTKGVQSANDVHSSETSPKKDNNGSEYRYAHLLPFRDPDTKYPPLTPFEHIDPGHRALSHPNPLSYLANAEKVSDLTPYIGTEIEGVDLTSLTDSAKDQIALHAARRGLLVFRDQQHFIDAGPDAYKAWGSYFGRLHIHPTSGHPKGYPELHLVYRSPGAVFNFERSDAISTTVFHSDVSYERQPPGLTALFLLSSPPVGGDTIFASSGALLRSLSPPFVAFLRTLKAVHSGVEQAEYSRKGNRGGIVRREPVEHVHPVVRRHPVTGEEVLYVNRQFTRKIVGFKREESSTILEFLYNHIEKGADKHARVRWAENTVVFWDNRVTTHTAIVDYIDSDETRHGARITPQAERPIPAWDGLILDD